MMADLDLFSDDDSFSFAAARRAWREKILDSGIARDPHYRGLFEIVLTLMWSVTCVFLLVGNLDRVLGRTK